MRKHFLIFIIGLISLCAYGDGPTAAKGIFSVAADKKVQFASSKVMTRPETYNLYQWSEAFDMQADGWVMLTEDEWTYLLAEGRTNASDLNSLGTVDGQQGLVILPDEWVKPDGVPDFSTAYMTYSFGANEYTSDQWALMEASGAVFLPCGGYGHYVDGFVFDGNETDHGTFWTTTGNGASNAYCMRFYTSTIHDQNYAEKTTYRSVILVRTVTPTVLDEDDDASNFATKLEAANDYDFAIVQRTLKKDSTLYTLCLPFDVPNIDVSPLVGAEVFTFEGGRVSGVPGQEVLHLNLRHLEGKRLTQGVPYILRWAKTNPVETLSELHFYNVENWDTNTESAADPGNDQIKFHGVYPQAAIPGYTSASDAHYNFFIGANNTLYWPDNTTYEGHQMKGFRAYFHVVPDPGPSSMPSYRAMPVVWQIDEAYDTTTGVENIQTPGKAVKILRDGHIYILYNGKLIAL